MIVHATTVARGGEAALLTGPPGAGKSDLALRLLDRGWGLVSDDRTTLARDDGVLVASAPATIAGLIEVRGVGIVAVGAHGPARVRLFVALGPETERLPAPRHETLLGVDVPRLVLDPRAASAPIKLEHAFARAAPALKPRRR